MTKFEKPNNLQEAAWDKSMLGTLETRGRKQQPSQRKKGGLEAINLVIISWILLISADTGLTLRIWSGILTFIDRNRQKD